MTRNHRKELKARLANGGSVTCQDMLNAFFLPEDQDAFARQQGWQDAEQMCFYENMSAEVPPMTDGEVDDMVARNQSADSEVLHLAHVSCEEFYTEETDWSGVY